MNKIKIADYVRPESSKFEPYVAGRPVSQIKRELGLKKVVKLASNENPLGPSKYAIKAIKSSAKESYFYPDGNSFLLKQAISEKFNIPVPQIILGAGSDEIIELIAKTFFKPTDDIVVSQYAFIRYKMAGDLMGCKVNTVPMRNYRHDLPAMLKAVTKKTKAVFIANPNNPTGTYNSTREVEAFLGGLSKKFGTHAPLVVMDEAYYEFSSINPDYPQTLDYLECYPNLIITRTFSKVYGLAGIRVGYGFASNGIAGFIDRVRPPFNINSAAQAAAVASLKDASQITKSVRLVEQQKKVLYAAFLKLGIEYIPSAGNFILFRSRPFGSTELFKLLLKKGVIVRAMDEYMLPDWVRVSVGLPSENAFFINKLQQLFKEGR